MNQYDGSDGCDDQSEDGQLLSPQDDQNNRCVFNERYNSSFIHYILIMCRISSKLN